MCLLKHLSLQPLLSFNGCSIAPHLLPYVETLVEIRKAEIMACQSFHKRIGCLNLKQLAPIFTASIGFLICIAKLLFSFRLQNRHNHYVAFLHLPTSIQLKWIISNLPTISQFSIYANIKMAIRYLDRMNIKSSSRTYILSLLHQ